MTQRFRIFVQGVAALAVAFPAHAHHAMDYRLPATALEGLLSGLGPPIIGIDHLLFILGAGVLAARLERGHWLPFLFVFASMLAAAARVSGAPWEMSELWIAGSLIVLGGTAITARTPSRMLVAVLFIVSGLLHGYALAAAIVGAEATPLSAYFVGLTLVQCGIALGAWAAARWLAVHRPQFAMQRATGFALGIAGVAFATLIALG